MKQLEQTYAYFRDGIIPFNDATLSIASAPVLYGLSVYTVFPVFWNPITQQFHPFRLMDHYNRLINSAKIMAFDDFAKNWSYDRFEREMNNLIAKNDIAEDCLVRVNVFVDDQLKGTRMHGLKHSLSAFVYPAAPLLPKQGAHLGVSSWRRTPDNAIPSRAKINGSYVNAALMKHEAVMSGFDDAIALDMNGHVAESTVSNIFLVFKGEVVTPNRSTDLLEGITRDTVFRLADHFGIKTSQRVVDHSELYIADEIFLTGSSMQVTPVIKIDHRPIGSGKAGPVTKKLADAYLKIGRHQLELPEL